LEGYNIRIRKQIERAQIEDFAGIAWRLITEFWDRARGKAAQQRTFFPFSIYQNYALRPTQ
jgi:hypothetical protein